MMIHRFVKGTLVLIYILIFIGGFVRASGAGLGCPDWPKCYGKWVPPVSEAQLPDDYIQTYHPDAMQDVSFNPVKTWTEYFNRLFGMAVGLSVLGVWILSLMYMRKDSFFVFLATFWVVLTGFQGWLGGVVVNSVLHPVMITLHMLTAVVMVLIGVVMVQRSSASPLVLEVPRSFSNTVKILLVLFLGQLLLGTQVREMVDQFIAVHGEMLPIGWVTSLPLTFKLHRTFSIILFVMVLKLVLEFAKLDTTLSQKFFKSVACFIVLVVVEILVGIGLAYGDLPPYLQPLHLGASILIFGILFHLLVRQSIRGFFKA